MTVAQLSETMTVAEEMAWIEYHTMIAEEQKAAAAAVKRGR